MKSILRRDRHVIGLGLYLLAGVLAHLAFYGEPSFDSVGSWLVVVLWPAILAWKTIVAAAVAAALSFACIAAFFFMVAIS